MSKSSPEQDQEDILSELAPPDSLGVDQFPRSWNMSAGFIFNILIKPDVPTAPEYIYIPLRGLSRDERVATALMIARWNVAWESAQLRSAMFRRKDAPPLIRRAVDVAPKAANIYFLPHTRTRYMEYAPIYHLLPTAVLERNGLPLLRKGVWPDTGIAYQGRERLFPGDFEWKLARAFAQSLWPRLGAGGRLGDFSNDDPIRLLAHNLDFWLPAVHRVVLEILDHFERGPRGHKDDPDVLARLRRAQQSLAPGVSAIVPRMGGDLWRGEAEATEVLGRVVEEADPDGRLRAVFDAIRSHRVHDDFSPHWSRAREDFERKINHSRARIKVTFVELTDVVPVQAPYTDVEDRMVFGDFMALLDRKERHIILLLHSGVTRVSEIAVALGYANHSPVSKRLERIRAKADRFFELN